MLLNDKLQRLELAIVNGQVGTLSDVRHCLKKVILGAALRRCAVVQSPYFSDKNLLSLSTSQNHPFLVSR